MENLIKLSKILPSNDLLFLKKILLSLYLNKVAKHENLTLRNLIMTIYCYLPVMRNKNSTIVAMAKREIRFNVLKIKLYINGD